jgi:hypothetical protein
LTLAISFNDPSTPTSPNAATTLMTLLLLSFASDLEFVSNLAVDLVIFPDASVNADALALAQIGLCIPCDALVLT